MLDKEAIQAVKAFRSKRESLVKCEKHLDIHIIFVEPNEEGHTRLCTQCLHYTDGWDVKRTHDEGC